MDFFNLAWYKYILIIGAGIIAGFINTIAGNGSAITLPLLIFMGLPANMANGTNRIGILLQSLVSSATFKKQRVLDLKEGIFLAVPTVVGSIAGALLAVKLNEKAMDRVIGLLLVLLFFIVLFKPEVWLKGRVNKDSLRFKTIQIAIFFSIGVYLGFIQAGVGLFLLAGLVLSVGEDLIRANALKNFLVFMCTIFALAVYILNSQVDFKIGLILAIGSTIGAWIGTKTALKKGAVFVRYILLLIILGSAIKLLFF